MDVIKRIDEFMATRGWTDYALSQNSGVSQSTISNFRKRGSCPSIETLESICNAFGITLSQFFSEGENTVRLTEEQKELFDKWITLSDSQKRLINDIIKEFN